jgi:hypothetical protein
MLRDVTGPDGIARPVRSTGDAALVSGFGDEEDAEQAVRHVEGSGGGSGLRFAIGKQGAIG